MLFVDEKPTLPEDTGYDVSSSGYQSPPERYRTLDSNPPPSYESTAGSPTTRQPTITMLFPALEVSPISPPTPHMPAPRLVTTAATSPSEKTRSVSHVSLCSRSDPISGTYFVDPCAPDIPLSLGLSKDKQREMEARDRALEQQHAKNMGRSYVADRETSASCGKSRSSGCGKSSKSSGCSEPSRCEKVTDGSGTQQRAGRLNGVFETREGRIALNLAIVGPLALSDTKTTNDNIRGHIMAQSRDGKIEVNIFELHESRRLDLDVSTVNGEIVVMLPPRFRGTVRLEQRNGGTHFLPAFDAHMSVVRTHDRNTFMIVGDPAGAEDEGVDHCFIGTRNGKVTIGLSGLDAA